MFQLLTTYPKLCVMQGRSKLIRSKRTAPLWCAGALLCSSHIDNKSINHCSNRDNRSDCQKQCSKSWRKLASFSINHPKVTMFLFPFSYILCLPCPFCNQGQILNDFWQVSCIFRKMVNKISSFFHLTEVATLASRKICHLCNPSGWTTKTTTIFKSSSISSYNTKFKSRMWNQKSIFVPSRIKSMKQHFQSNQGWNSNFHHL